MSDQSTILCGVKIDDKGRFVVLDHVALDGSHIAQRAIRPKSEKGEITDLTCVRWNDGIAVFGGVTGFPSGTGWFAEFDSHANPQSEKLGDEYVSIDVIEAAAGGLFLVNPFFKNPDGSTASVMHLAQTGEIIARHPFGIDDGPMLIRSAVPKSSVRVALFKTTLDTDIVDLDDQLQKFTRVIKLHNAGVNRALELPDGSIAIFGSQFRRNATAAVTRVYADGSSKGFIVEPQNQSGWYYDAVYTGSNKEFAAVRIIEGMRAVLDFVSFK